MANNLFQNVYNPDVLSCIANLSNDEVFTPPELANKMLDLLPQELFENPDTTFLDPCCKSGVFLREITKRLIKGLEHQIPDVEKRLEHIFTRQVFGIAITELTSLLSRRSLYCSKYPSSEFSAYQFPEDQPQGNIIYQRIKHTWEKGKCIYCGASQSEYDRGSELEAYAYQFIHNVDVNKLFNMKFDVIIGNPPYQLSDGGHGASAIPIYQKFIVAAKMLTPQYIAMIVPSRWFTGGRGLDEFREEMLNDRRLRIIHDFADASDCFSGVEIKGGVNYFLWDKDYDGLCEINSHMHDGKTFSIQRPLLEEGLNVFIRDSRSIAILRKVRSQTVKYFTEIVSANDPFGYDVRVENSYFRVKPDIKNYQFSGALKIYYFGWRENGVGYIDPNSVRKSNDIIDKNKVYIPRAWGSGNPIKDRLNPFIGERGSVCTETYSVVGPSDNIEHCENIVSYINTKFFHFLVSLVKITQAAAKHVYKLVPLQDFSHPWTDEMLYEKYGLTDEEIAFIESMIRPME